MLTFSGPALCEGGSPTLSPGSPQRAYPEQNGLYLPSQRPIAFLGGTRCIRILTEVLILEENKDMPDRLI